MAIGNLFSTAKRVSLLSLSCLGLSACAYGGAGGYYGDGYYGGASLSVGSSGYSSYCDPWSTWNSYYDCDYRYGYGQIGYGGGYWNNFYYPGHGVYIFDRGGQRFRMDDRHRNYWSRQRYDWWRNRGDRREDRREWREDRRDDRGEWREDRREWREERRENRRERRRDRRGGFSGGDAAVIAPAAPPAALAPERPNRVERSPVTRQRSLRETPIGASPPRRAAPAAIAPVRATPAPRATPAERRSHIASERVQED